MKVAIIGGGASGLFAAAVLSKYVPVVVYERNEKAGKKIYITGKGRCNFTNLCDQSEFLASVVNGSKFLISAVHSFLPKDAVKFFDDLGMRSVVERGNRVFPLSNKASDVTAALSKEISRNGGQIILNSRIEKIEKSGEQFAVCLSGEKYIYDKVVLATGGVSYPQTGSTGDGYGFARSFGHTIVEPRAALCPLILREDVSSIQGLSLKNVSASVTGVKSEFGEMLFTDRGVSGPIILTLSSKINRLMGERQLSVNLKPALTDKELDARLLRDFNANINRELKNSLFDLLPKSLIPYIIGRSGISPDKKINLITKEERSRLVMTLKNLTFTVVGLDKIDNAIITSGGVKLSEISPSSMESKLVRGLYIVGELLDVDALTGGFNLHIAWATAHSAARHIIGGLNGN